MLCRRCTVDPTTRGERPSLLSQPQRSRRNGSLGVLRIHTTSPHPRERPRPNNRSRRPGQGMPGCGHIGRSCLEWVGHDRDTLLHHGRLCELRRLRSPAAHGVAGLLRFRCVDSQEPHAKSTPVVVADVDGVAVYNFQDGRGNWNGISRRRWRCAETGPDGHQCGGTDRTGACLCRRMEWRCRPHGLARASRFAGDAVVVAITAGPVVRVALGTVPSPVLMGLGAVGVRPVSPPCGDLGVTGRWEINQSPCPASALSHAPSGVP